MPQHICLVQTMHALRLVSAQKCVQVHTCRCVPFGIALWLSVNSMADVLVAYGLCEKLEVYVLTQAHQMCMSVYVHAHSFGVGSLFKVRTLGFRVRVEGADEEVM